VVLEPADGGAAARTRLSDLNGWFVFESVEPGRYILRLDRPIQVGGELLEPVAGDSDQREVEVASGATAWAPTFRLERRRRVGTVSGRLRDGDGDGVAGVPVTLFADGGPPQVEHTDPRGVYTFRQVAPGVQLVSVPTPATAGGVDWRPVPPDAGQRTVNVRAGATTQVPDIELEPVPVLRTVSGSVVVNGTPNGLAGVKLEVRPAAGGPPLITVTTGQGGGFSVRLPADTWAIAPAELPIRIGALAFRPLPPGDPGTRVVQVGTSDEVADPLVVEPVAAPVAITGRVLDAGVTPAAGLQGVRVRLRPAAGGSARFAVTGPGGGFTFEDAQNGRFVVELEANPFELAGDQWEPVIGDSGTRQVTVQDAPVDVGSLLVQRERHRIVGTVTRPDGSAAAFLPIRLLDELGQLVLEVTTDFDGRYDADVQREGRFILEIRQDGRTTRRPVTVESDVRLDLTIDDDVVGGGAATAATQDFAAFPVLTEAVTPAQLPAAGGPISSIGQTVEGALREALGWRPRPSDPRAFNAALLQSFSRVEVEGHTEATWTPRTYAAQVQADLGAITGAQASLYSRARVALDAALPLLDGLRPLDPAADEQDTEAIRSIIRSELVDLVTELGVEGGPRISRVDDLLDLLLGPAVARAGATATTPAEGQLGELLRRFGLDADRVETVDEEEVLTNALILVDYVREIDTSWQQRRGIFDPTSTQTPFLGTQLVLLSRSLAVTAESVTEVGFTLDSVFLGAAERLAIRLTFTDIDQPEGLPLKDSKGNTITVPGNTPSILLEELLRWVERVASEEGPRLLQDGGKDGASALTPVLDRLRMLVRGSLVTTGTGPSKGLQSPESVPAGYATARVQRALSELAKYLDDAADLARGIQRTPVRR
jgi:hypothetical protein